MSQSLFSMQRYVYSPSKRSSCSPFCLLEAHVTVAVAILQIGNQPADGEHAGAVAVKALVGPLAVILVRLKELVVGINVVSSVLRKLGHGFADAP